MCLCVYTIIINVLVQLESSASNASGAFWSRPIDKTVVGGSSVTRFPVPNTSFLRAKSKPRIKPRSVIRYHVPPSPFAGLHGVVMTTSLKHLNLFLRSCKCGALDFN